MLPYYSRTSPNESIRIVVICALLINAPNLSAGIQGSVHDLSASGVTVEICNVCHTPHANIDNSPAPLWNHEVSTAVYTLYSSSTMDVPVEQPGPGSPSRLCLSCHDGTISIDSFGGNPGTPDNRLTGIASKGTDLSNDHPIGIQWIHQTQGNGTSTTCMNCHDIHNITAPPGKELKFFSGRVECPSCHDVHNSQVMDVKLLRKPLAGSELCLHCHPK
jgi:predicted CXXCH cytochrome family protein